MRKIGKTYNILETDQFSEEKILHKKDGVCCEERDAF